MNFLKYLIIVILGFYTFAILILSARSKKALKYLFLNAILGFVAFLILYFIKDYIGLSLALNTYTGLFSCIFGIPGVIFTLLLNLIF